MADGLVQLPNPLRPSYADGYAPRDGIGTPGEDWFWDGLVGAWMPTFGATGNSLWDVSLRGNHGTLVNGPSWPPSPNGGALLFDNGASQDAVVSGVDATPELSIALRFIPLDDAFDSLMSRGILDTDQDWLLRTSIPKTDMQFRVRASGTTRQLTFDIPDSTEYHSLVVTYKAPTATAYVDGQFVDSGSITDGVPLATNVKDIYLASIDGGSYGTTSIESWSIHARILTLSQIQALHEDSARGFRLAPAYFPLSTGAPPAGAIMNQMQGSNLGADLFNGTLIA